MCYTVFQSPPPGRISPYSLGPVTVPPVIGMYCLLPTLVMPYSWGGAKSTFKVKAYCNVGACLLEFVFLVMVTESVMFSCIF